MRKQTFFCCYLHPQILFTKVEIKDYAVVDYANWFVLGYPFFRENVKVIALDLWK